MIGSAYISCSSSCSAKAYSKLFMNLLKIRLKYPGIPIAFGLDLNLPTVFWSEESLDYSVTKQGSSLQTRIAAEIIYLINKVVGNVQLAKEHSQTSKQLDVFFGTAGLVEKIEVAETLFETGGDAINHEPHAVTIQFPDEPSQEVLINML